MIHLGDITKISGHDAPVVDCVIGGSPCQDLSVAGKRAGLAGARSGLFMEQIRVIKEMREADANAGRPANLIRPRFMLWENVPGAFSSNKGEDFRVVLEEIIRIAEPDAPDVPLPERGGWPMADAWMGDGWSVAYRVFDAQFWGTPQRRRRIALVADFGGQSAPEILFNRKSLYGNIEPGEEAGEEDTAGAGGGAGEAIGADGMTCYPINTMVATRETPEMRTTFGVGEDGDPQFTLSAAHCHAVAVFENHGQDSRLTGPLDVAPTVSQKSGTGGNNTPLVVQEKAFGVDCRNATEHEELNGTLQAKPNGGFSLNLNQTVRIERTACMATGQANAEILEDLSPTLNCNHEQPIVGTFQNTGRGWWNASPVGATIRTPGGGDSTKANLVVQESFVRRLTPTECERLQGYPDGWTDIGAWTDSKGKLHKESSDSARYRALGNSIALPSWKWVIKRLCGHYERDATMASLFDGIGGFPLIWEQINGRGSCLWASEIEEFPIAVTKRRFGEGAGT